MNNSLLQDALLDAICARASTAPVGDLFEVEWKCWPLGPRHLARRLRERGLHCRFVKDAPLLVVSAGPIPYDERYEKEV